MNIEQNLKVQNIIGTKPAFSTHFKIQIFWDDPSYIKGETHYTVEVFSEGKLISSNDVGHCKATVGLPDNEPIRVEVLKKHDRRAKFLSILIPSPEIIATENIDHLVEP